MLSFLDRVSWLGDNIQSRLPHTGSGQARLDDDEDMCLRNATCFWVLLLIPTDIIHSSISIDPDETFGWTLPQPPTSILTRAWHRSQAGISSSCISQSRSRDTRCCSNGARYRKNYIFDTEHQRGPIKETDPVAKLRLAGSLTSLSPTPVNHS